MTLLPSLAQIVAPLLRDEPRHCSVARTNQLNLAWEKDEFGKGLVTALFRSRAG